MLDMGMGGGRRDVCRESRESRDPGGCTAVVVDQGAEPGCGADTAGDVLAAWGTLLCGAVWVWTLEGTELSSMLLSTSVAHQWGAQRGGFAVCNEPSREPI